MLRAKSICVLVCAFVMGTGLTIHAAPKLFQLDDFETTGSTQNWTNGPTATDPANITTGGPNGANDNFLRVTSRGGSGGGSRLIVFNQTQWAGNFFNTQINSVEMDLKDFGTTPLSMRIAFKGAFASKVAFLLPADSQWHHAVFSIAEADLTKLGSLTYKQALTNVSQFRILDSVTPDDQGAVIASSFGVDNIHAIPEPTAAILLIIPLLFLCRPVTRRAPSPISSWPQPTSRRG